MKKTITNNKMGYDNDKILELIKTFELKTITKGTKVLISRKSIMKKLVIHEKYYDLAYNSDDDANDEQEKYMTGKELYDLLPKLKSHPEHYNIHQIVGLDIKFRKQQEIETLAILYDHYRNEYDIYYQMPALEFKLDSGIVMNVGRNGGIAIEIDEDDHGKYMDSDHEDRQKILEACGYYFVRITPNMYTTEELIEFVDKEISNYQFIYSQNIDPKMLWKELKNKNIDKDFFDVIGKSIVSNKTFCVEFPDVVDFVGYSRKSNAKRVLISTYRRNIDFVELTPEEANSRDDVTLITPEQLNKWGGNNKKIIFLTKFAFYSFIFQANLSKAKKIRMHVIDIYNKYHDLLMYCRNQLIDKHNDNDQKVALETYKKRQEDKFNNYKQKKAREIKTLIATLTEVRRQKKELEDNVNHLQYDYEFLKKERSSKIIKIKEVATNDCDVKTKKKLLKIIEV